MAEVQKPIVPTDTPAAEPAIAAPATEIPALEAKPDTTEAPAALDTTTDTAAAAPLEESKPAEPAAKVAEPIYSGALGYKAPGLIKSLIFSKKYFWFGEEEAVPSTSLNTYLRGEKPEISHPAATWSSQTGKGLLYFAKHADDKKTPSGLLNLSEATDLKKEGVSDFSFKIGTHKHTFETKQLLERDGWFLALEKAVEDAKASAEGIKSSEGYKEAFEKLSQPTTVAAAGATPTKAEDKTPKKSTEVLPIAEGEARPTSSDDEATKKKSKSKSRSVSRGKRSSIFGSLLGKKEEADAKKELKKEEETKPVESTEAPALDPIATEPAIDAAPIAALEPTVIADESAKPAETTEATAIEPTTETAPVAPKPSKRNSVIGNFFEKIRSPTHEKKQSELVPAVPAKDEVKEPEAAPALEEPAVEAAPATTEATEPLVAPAVPAEESKAAEVPTTTPKKDKKGFSFDKVFGAVKEKVKSPSSEKPPAIEAPKAEEAPITEEAPKIEEAPAVEAAAPVTEATEPIQAEETAAPATETEALADRPKEKRKSSFFGNLKKEKPNGEVKAEEKEKHPSKLSGLFRNPSKAVKSKKEKESVPKTEETETTKEEPVAEEAAAATEEKKTEPATIGDVVPEAISVGQPASSTAVPAAA